MSKTSNYLFSNDIACSQSTCTCTCSIMFDFTLRWLNLNFFLIKILVFSLIHQNFTMDLINVTYMSSYIHKAFLKNLFITNYLMVMNISNIDMHFVISNL